MSGNCWNPVGWIDWHNVGISIWLAESFFLASLSSAWYFYAPHPAPPPMPLLFVKHPLCILIFLMQICAFSLETGVSMMLDAPSVNHQSLRKEESVQPSITTHLSSSLALVTYPDQWQYWVFLGHGSKNFCLEVLCSGRCSKMLIRLPGWPRFIVLRGTASKRHSY